MSNQMIPSLVLLITYVLLVLEKLPRVVVALLGACTVIITKVVTQEEAFAYIDFNVIFLLVGMMILVNVLAETGALKLTAFYIAKKAKGNGIRLMIYFAVLTAILSAFLDNVTTVVIIASVTCTLAKELKINPLPYLVSEIIASNVGGTATLIGDPPNIMIGSAAKLIFNDFIIHIAPIIFIILPISIITLYFFYKKDLQLPKNTKNKLEKIQLKELITNRKLLTISLFVISFVLLGFFLHGVLELEVGTIALAGASVLLIFENKKDIWNDVEWPTIFFFIGLFIVVGAVEKVGTLDYLSKLILNLSKGSFEILTLSVLWLSAIMSALIDNIPYTATMIPMIKNIGGHFQDIQPLWWALSLGACLGGNGTLIGASANIIVADMANKSGHPIRFIEFFKIGGLITVQSLIISSLYLWFRYIL